MNKTSKTYPVIFAPNGFGSHEFNYNIVETENGYTYDSVDVAGEPTRDNIKYVLMLEHYTQEEIYEMENVKRFSTKKADKTAYETYLDKKTECNNIISEMLGADFKQLN